MTSFLFLDQALYKYRQVLNSHSNDPEKRCISRRNHRLAYENALQRHNIHGVQRLLHLFYFRETYAGQRITPALLLPLGRFIKQIVLLGKR